MKFRWISLLLLVCVSFAIAGCVRDSRPPNTLRLSLTTDPGWLDPARAYDDNSIPYARLLYRGLVDYDDDAQIVNEVAQSRTVSPDGKTYTFTLRPDVFFVNRQGQKVRRVVAEDFRFALERVLDPATASDGLSQYTMIDGAAEFSKAREKSDKVPHVRGIEVQGDNRIIFKLKQADATFLNYLALPFAYAVPREHVQSLKKADKSLSENPLGCGPFLLDEWVHDGWLNLKRNPHYFHRDLPRAQRIEFQIGVSPTLQTMMFEQGRTDVLSLTASSAPEYLRFKKAAQWQPALMHAPMMDVRYLCLNTEMKPFNDVRVRRAMNYAIDRDRIVSFQSGRATKARGALPPGMPGFDPQSFQYSYDPKKAKQLLREAGYANGFPKTLTLWYSNSGPWIPMAAQSIQQNLRAVGSPSIPGKPRMPTSRPKPVSVKTSRCR
jgi:ABC-type transport system substrate-binding protein